MARIRTIKPEFWADEKLSPLSALTRLVFLGLIGMADDAGRIVDSPRAIDGFIFPETQDCSATALEELCDLGRIDRGVTASGQRIIQLVNWKHQKIDKPNMAAALPPIAIFDESCRRRRSIPAKVRDAIFERDGGVCQRCGVAVRRDKRDRYDADPDLAEVDHVVAVVDGGSNAPQNLRLLCLGCNRKRAGEEVRRRNAEQSPTSRRNVAEEPSNHSGSGTSTSTDDQRAGAAIPERDLDPEGRGALTAADLNQEPDVIAFIVRHYPRGQTPPARRRDVVNQLLATLGDGARYRRGRVRAHSLKRLAAKCREVLREGMKDPDKAIVVLLAKLSDTSDVSAERQRRELEQRVEEERTEAHDVAAADTWLADRPDIAAAIDEQLDAEGLVAGDALQDSVRRITARSLLLAAWRADGAPELVSKS